MYRIKLTTSSPEWPIQRQTPGESGIWGNCQFFIDKEIEECDYWVVYEDLPTSQVTRCPPQNTLLITAEPPSVKTYSPEFLRQFSTIITCNRKIKGSRVIYAYSSLPWHVGRRSSQHQNLGFRKNYDELVSIETFEKKRLISVITSNKKFTRGHRQRIDFVNQLKQHFGTELDVFGRGINDIEDKWDAIAGYKYHIALENCSYPDYWTEKLSDVYLGGAVPIYYGCPNLVDYFPAGAFITINYDIQEAVSVIRKTIDEDRYDQYFPEIIRSRKLVLDKYNLFPRLHDWANQSAANGPKELVSLKPSQQCAFLTTRVEDRLRRIISRII